MRRIFRFFYATPAGWLFLLMIIAVVGVFIFFQRGEQASQSRTVATTPFPTVDFSIKITPAAPYAILNPNSTNALLNNNPLSNPNSLPVTAPNIPPIGVYLPGLSTEQVVLEFEALPIPENDENANVNSDAAGSAALLEYAGDDCAPVGLPVSGILTQRYHAYHNAIDIGVPLGTPINATHSGEVIFAGWSTVGYGYLVILQNGRFITYYAHMTNFNVQAGDKVGAGSVLGWSGSTGNSSGPHLHYETRLDDVALDPLTFEQRGYPGC